MPATLTATYLSGARLLVNRDQIRSPSSTARSHESVQCQANDEQKQPAILSRRDVLSALGVAAAAVALPVGANSITESELRRRDWSASINGGKGAPKLPAVSLESPEPSKPKDVDPPLRAQAEEPEPLTLPSVGKSSAPSSFADVNDFISKSETATAPRPVPAPAAKTEPRAPPSLPPNPSVSPVEFHNSEGVDPLVWAGIAFAGLTTMIVVGNKPEDLPPPPSPPANDAAVLEDK